MPCTYIPLNVLSWLLIKSHPFFKCLIMNYFSETPSPMLSCLLQMEVIILWTLIAFCLYFFDKYTKGCHDPAQVQWFARTTPRTELTVIHRAMTYYCERRQGKISKRKPRENFQPSKSLPPWSCTGCLSFLQPRTARTWGAVSTRETHWRLNAWSFYWSWLGRHPLPSIYQNSRLL